MKLPPLPVVLNKRIHIFLFCTFSSFLPKAMSFSSSVCVNPVPRVLVSGAGSSIVNGAYLLRTAKTIPAAFDLVCRQSRWDTRSMWERLNGNGSWWESDNGSYIYLNRGDGKWWMDSGETGLGLYVRTARSGESPNLPPADDWEMLGDAAPPLPSVATEQQ